MRIAFYLPGGRLPEPLHGNGDGSGAGSADLLDAALRLAAHEVRIASRFRSRGDGPAAAPDERLRDIGLRLADRLLARHRRRPPEERPEAWLTCAVSIDAPDWLGPAVSRGLGIPYILVQPYGGPPGPEAAPTAAGAALRSALAAADAIIVFGSAGLADLRAAIDRPERLVELFPFLDLGPISVAFRDRQRHRAALAGRLLLSADAPWLIAMAGTESAPRHESVPLLARALSRIPFLDWNLIVVGDPPACGAADATLSVLPRPRVKLYPSLAAEDLVPLYVAGDLFLGPAIGEETSRAAMLFAMASGLPIVACRGEGAVADIVRDGVTGTLTLPGNAESYSNAVSFLLRQPGFRDTFAGNARSTALADHDIGATAQALDETLRRTIAGKPGGGA